MKKIILLLIIICLSVLVLAEDKFSTDMVPKLTAEEMKGAPKLLDDDVYPVWGVPCTNFTYHVTYQDAQGRAPEYVRINLNGQWHEMTKVSGDYQTGAVYHYYLVPDSGKQLFYYYEASNGYGKARGSIIDSPDQGPLLFSEKLDNNQIILLDKNGKEVWNYEIGRDWVEGVALSQDGNYAAAVTNVNIHFFSKESSKPVWTFCTNCQLPAVVSSQMEGIAISTDGSYIAGTYHGKLYYFNKESKEPLWSKDIESGAIGVDMSDDGKVIAVGVASAGNGKGDKIFVFDNQGNKIFEYKPEVPGYEVTGDFYRPDVTPNGKYISASTGCPDRKAYLFSNKGLVFRSDQLTQDSPIHKSAISDDGSLIAYSADHATGKEIVFLYNNLGKKIWGFSSQEDGTARAVSISGDGNYIAAGTSTGHIYFFSKESNSPKWKFTDNQYFSQFGEVKLNQDGSLLAAGGTTKKVYLFSKKSNQPLWEYKTNTWITKLDFNGEYILAGTGPREYFFEGKSLTDDKLVCSEIIQPPARNSGPVNSENINVGAGDLANCGNQICEPPEETENNCCEDCKTSGCDGTMDSGMIQDEITDDTGNSFCAQFDGNQESCYAYPKECNWIKADELCEEKKSASGLAVKKSGDEIITEDNLDTDETKEKSEMSFFGKIIGWFREWFK